jgi:hypothetical protein
MKRISPISLLGALTFILLLAAACAPAEETAHAQNALTSSPTAFATDTTATAETLQATATNTTLTPSIPVTGSEVIVLQCQYCVDNIAHALLLIPREAKFKVTSPPELVSDSRNNNGDDDNGNGNDDGEDKDNGGDDDDDNGNRMGCHTVDRFRDKKLVLCRAEENTTITLNVCLDDNNCTEVQITLQPCTLPTSTPTIIATITITATPATATVTPGTITATVTPTSTSGTTTSTVTPATGTPTPTGVTNTPIPSPTGTPTATFTTTSTPTP